MTQSERLALEFVTQIFENPLRNFAIPPHLLPDYLRFGPASGNQYLLSTIFLAGWKARGEADAAIATKAEIEYAAQIELSEIKSPQAIASQRAASYACGGMAAAIRRLDAPDSGGGGG